ncbi:MAG: hypothetical protein CBD88_00870 [Flavobacteriales bacterium TMED228]|nr:MAG: hypothetical protein CBD88_00870 [Flavobacteriales bacterium TMED228]|tara:strand:+ start:5781 stop:6062 length:282 start_codon:yes stop_codon:yes gene_type:complete
MNRKTYKKVRRHAELILLEWVKTLVPEESKDDILANNLGKFLPADGHFSTDSGNRVNFYTKRWAIRSIKKLIAQGYILNNITMRDLESTQKRK